MSKQIRIGICGRLKTKASVTHCESLSDAACDLIARVLDGHGNEIVFPGDVRGKARGSGAMLRVRGRMLPTG